MRKINTETLKEILKEHSLWLETRYSSEIKGKRAELNGVDLYGMNLSGVNLSEAYLSLADLSGSNLIGANLKRTYLNGANLNGVDLYRANLKGAYLYEAIGIHLACPEKGEFIGFKRAKNDLIVELLILEDSKRSSATGRKCRCDKAKVLSVTSIDKTKQYESAISNYDSNFIYTVGETVSVDNFDSNMWNECAPGIHFFITRKEAINYLRF